MATTVDFENLLFEDVMKHELNNLEETLLCFTIVKSNQHSSTELQEHPSTHYVKAESIITVKSEIVDEEAFIRNEVDDIHVKLKPPVIEEINIKSEIELKDNFLQCKFCKCEFLKEDELSLHMQTHTDETSMCKVCKVCYDIKTSIKQDSCSQNLLAPTRSYPGQRHFKCEVCDYRAIQKIHLQTHMRTHTGEKPFKCEFCSRKFTAKPTLLIHIRTHTGERPFQCALCNHKFSAKSILRNYMRIHSGEKPYKCGKCNYRGSQKGHVDNHMKTHMGEKPFTCVVCNRSFSFKKSLFEHMKTHAGKREYRCKVCNLKYLREPYLHKHMKIHKKK